MVSVSMITYNAEPFIREALEGILSQRVDFPYEVVIGDDGSSDGTMTILHAYQQRYPDRIRVLASGPNLGIAGNTRRTLDQCAGTFIAICDGDDVWIDPDKLQAQVDFLEAHPDHGMVYTDVVTINAQGRVIDDPEHVGIREQYADGEVFFALLGANFINNSSAMFRRELIADHRMDAGRGYQIPDHIRWLHIAARSKVGFLPARTTSYRKHEDGLSVQVPSRITRGNRRALLCALQRILPAFNRRYDRPLDARQRELLFRRSCAAFFRVPGAPRLKWHLLQLILAHRPGMVRLRRLLHAKIRSAPISIQFLYVVLDHAAENLLIIA